MHQFPFLIGVDGGGTKCKATVFDADLKPVADGVAGPANVSREIHVAQQSIVESIELALRRAGVEPADLVPNLPVYAGLAGANIASARGALSTWHHPFKSFAFTSDLYSAVIGAHAGKDGSVLIVGTGSCAASLCANKIQQFGGYGFLLGDKGSGAWLGKTLVSFALNSIDGVMPESDLTCQLFDNYECKSAEMLVDVFNQRSPALFAQLAPMVIEAAQHNDPIGLAIVSEACDYLNIIADRALQRSGGSLALVGGVANAIKPWLSPTIQAVCSTPKESPEWGALYYFQHIYHGDSDV